MYYYLFIIHINKKWNVFKTFDIQNIWFYRSLYLWKFEMENNNKYIYEFHMIGYDVF